jgi:hypothetical protein
MGEEMDETRSSLDENRRRVMIKRMKNGVTHVYVPIRVTL